jgi:hypothetical protein
MAVHLPHENFCRPLAAVRHQQFAGTPYRQENATELISSLFPALLIQISTRRFFSRPSGIIRCYRIQFAESNDISISDGNAVKAPILPVLIARAFSEST